VKVADDDRLYRFGTEIEDAKKLEADCERAFPQGFPHGVSVRSVSNRSDASVAMRAEVELYFSVHKTGLEPHHFTIELPHPVTLEAAERFNRLFGRTGERNG
jgi:hypothetical protein